MIYIQDLKRETTSLLEKYNYKTESGKIQNLMLIFVGICLNSNKSNIVELVKKIDVLPKASKKSILWNQGQESNNIFNENRVLFDILDKIVRKYGKDNILNKISLNSITTNIVENQKLAFHQNIQLGSIKAFFHNNSFNTKHRYGIGEISSIFFECIFFTSILTFFTLVPLFLLYHTVEFLKTL
jgi:uncharacterized protein YehS (DUF1456 family)